MAKKDSFDMTMIVFATFCSTSGIGKKYCKNILGNSQGVCVQQKGVTLKANAPP